MRYDESNDRRSPEGVEQNTANRRGDGDFRSGDIRTTRTGRS